jgi:hypothetical protein
MKSEEQTGALAPSLDTGCTFVLQIENLVTWQHYVVDPGIWNYNEKSSELVKFFPEEAYSIAFHPSGLHVLVGFADKLRLMNLLMDDIRPYKARPSQ